MEIDIVSLFPEYIKGPLQESILKRAQERGFLNLRHIDLRIFGEGPHKRVDDTVYGGGPGMVLTAPAVKSALQSVRRSDSHVIYLSPQGKLLTQKRCAELSQKKHLILLAGHYEGIDERILESEVDEEISIGDFILTNGALAAIVVVDAVVRLIPGVLGDEQSAREDSFTDGLFDCPHYTKPQVFEGKSVPQTLLQGDHAAIAKWRKMQAHLRTRLRRPDLYFSYLAKFSDSELAHVSNENQEIDKKINISIVVENLKKSTKFYEKRLKMTPLSTDETSVSFKEGFTLAKGEKKAYPFLLIYTLRDKSAFDGVYTMLLKERRIIGALREIERGFEASFIDEEETPWILRYLERM